MTLLNLDGAHHGHVVLFGFELLPEEGIEPVTIENLTGLL